MSVLPQLIYRFNEIPPENSSRIFLIETNKLIIKCIWKVKETRIAKNF